MSLLSLKLWESCLIKITLWQKCLRIAVVCDVMESSVTFPKMTSNKWSSWNSVPHLSEVKPCVLNTTNILLHLVGAPECRSPRHKTHIRNSEGYSKSQNNSLSQFLGKTSLSMMGAGCRNTLNIRNNKGTYYMPSLEKKLQLTQKSARSPFCPPYLSVDCIIISTSRKAKRCSAFSRFWSDLSL